MANAAVTCTVLSCPDCTIESRDCILYLRSTNEADPHASATTRAASTDVSDSGINTYLATPRKSVRRRHGDCTLNANEGDARIAVDKLCQADRLPTGGRKAPCCWLGGSSRYGRPTKCCVQMNFIVVEAIVGGLPGAAPASASTLAGKVPGALRVNPRTRAAQRWG